SATLSTYYRRKRKSTDIETPDFFDGDLLTHFPLRASVEEFAEPASKFIRRHRKDIIKSLSLWTGEKKYTIHKLYSKLLLRTQELQLVRANDESICLLQFSVWVASLLTSYRLTGRWARRTSV